MNKRLASVLLLSFVLGLPSFLLFGCGSGDDVFAVIQEGFAYFADAGGYAVEGYFVNPSTGDLTSTTSANIPWSATSGVWVSDFEVSDSSGFVLACENSMSQIAALPIEGATGALGTAVTSSVFGWAPESVYGIEEDEGLVALLGKSGSDALINGSSVIGSTFEFRTIGPAGFSHPDASNQMTSAAFMAEMDSAVLENGFFAVGSAKDGVTPGGGVLWAQVQSSDATITSTGFVPLTDAVGPDALWVRDLKLTSTSIVAIYYASTHLRAAILDRSAGVPTLLGSVDLAAASENFSSSFLVLGTRAWIATNDGSHNATIHVLDFANPTAPTVSTAITLANVRSLRPSFIVGSKVVVTGETQLALGPITNWVRSYTVNGATGAWSEETEIAVLSGTAMGKSIDAGRLQIVCDGNGLAFHAVVVDAASGAFDDKDSIPLNVGSIGATQGAIYLKP